MTIDHDNEAASDSSRESRGSIFDERSEACHAALNDLSVFMKEVGFIVDKKRDAESTLRSYLRERLTYPLLNPRFKRCVVQGLSSRRILEITVLSKGDEAISSRLAAFPSSASTTFIPLQCWQGVYLNHGYFAVPLVFRGQGRRRVLDVRALGPALTGIIRHLEGAA